MTNSQINLSAIRDVDSIIEKHFIDSLLLTKHWDLQGKVLDLGTGGGFPWIPLALVNPKTQFTLVDSIGKKVKVVNEFIQTLGIENAQAIQARAEELWQSPLHRGKYDLVISRATAYLPTLLEYTLPLLKIWGVFIAYKLADSQEMLKSQKALDTFSWEIIAQKGYSLAWQNRVFLIIQKIWETPKKYPRTIWEPLKNPII